MFRRNVPEWKSLFQYVSYQCKGGVPLKVALSNMGYKYVGLKKEENKMAIPLTADTDSQKRIVEITEGMKDLLLYKNHKYGDSALKPKHRFYKGDSTNSILIRLDDKIGRIESNTDELPRVNDVADLIGYLTLLLVSMGVTKEDLAKFMD